MTEKPSPSIDTAVNKDAPTNVAAMSASTPSQPEKLPTKLTLEKRKLNEEVKEIEERNRVTHRTLLQNEIRSWTTLVGGMLTGIGAIVTLVFQGGNYLDQRKSENQFQVNSEIIKLVNQLNDPRPESQQNAAILLSFFGEQPVPILISQLDIPEGRANNYPKPITIQKSLELIIHRDSTNQSMINSIVNQLIDQSKSAYGRALRDEKNLSALDNYLETLLLLKHVRPKQIQPVLDKMKEGIEKSKLDKEYRDKLIEKLTQGI